MVLHLAAIITSCVSITSCGVTDAHGDLAVTAAQKAEALNGQFSSVFTMDDGNLPDFAQRSRVNLSNINLSAERVRKFMCMLPNKFSRSPDGIPSAVCVLRCIFFSKCQSIVEHILCNGKTQI